MTRGAALILPLPSRGGGSGWGDPQRSTVRARVKSVKQRVLFLLDLHLGHRKFCTLDATPHPLPPPLTGRGKAHEGEA